MSKIRTFHTEGDDVNINKILPQHPCRMIISGPSNCGKTNLLLNLIFDPDMPWDSISLFYGTKQKKYDLIQKYCNGEVIESNGEQIEIPAKKRSHQKKKYKSTSPEGQIPFEMFEGLPSADWNKWLKSDERQTIPHLIIIDDLMLQTEKSDTINKLFTIGSHHSNCTIINLCQSIFTNKLQRNNADYYLTFNFDQDMTQIRTLFLQLEPTHWRELMEVYEEIMKTPYSWFLVDLRCKNLGMQHLKYRANGFDSVIDFENKKKGTT